VQFAQDSAEAGVHFGANGVGEEGGAAGSREDGVGEQAGKVWAVLTPPPGLTSGAQPLYPQAGGLDPRLAPGASVFRPLRGLRAPTPRLGGWHRFREGMYQVEGAPVQCEDAPDGQERAGCATVPGPQRRGTGGTLSVVGNGRDRGHPPCADTEQKCRDERTQHGLLSVTARSMTVDRRPCTQIASSPSL